MRDFLHSEIAAMNGMANLPDDPDLAIAAGRKLCEDLLEPLQATFGRLAIRSAYRSPEVNAYGNAHFQNCGSNERNRARHIWDQRSRDGGMGAMTSVVVPWLVDHLEKGVTWQVPGRPDSPAAGNCFPLTRVLYRISTPILVLPNVSTSVRPNRGSGSARSHPV